jgi:hypothetical protein
MSMPSNKVSALTDNGQHEPFITIDDALSHAQELYDCLRRLSEYKHPLAIRKGVHAVRKEVEDMVHAKKSKTVKAGSRTYFFDVKEIRDGGKNYLVITESRFKKGGEERARNQIMVFPEDVSAFVGALQEVVTSL